MTDPGRTLQVHLIQLGYDDLEPVPERISRAADLVRAQRGADLVILPELWAAGAFAYSRWPERAERLDGPSVTAIAAAAGQIGAIVHAGSILELVPGGEHGLCNTSVLLGPDGQLLATYRKIHRFGFGEGEPVLLDAGEQVTTAVLEVPNGGQVTVGLATCYDLRFPEMFRMLVDLGCEVFVVPAGWPAARVEHWTLLGRARALENQSWMLQCNTVGIHAGLTMGGGSQVVAPTGEVVAQAGTDEQVLVARLDLDCVARYRSTFPVLADRRL